MKWSRFVNWLTLRAIVFALKKPEPKSYSLERENWPNIDYYSVHISTPDGAKYTVQSLRDGTISCLKWDGQRFSIHENLSVEAIPTSEIGFDHRFRGVRTKYKGSIDLLLGKATFNERRYILRQWISQSLYNRTLKFRSDRIQLLEALVEIHLKERHQLEIFERSKNLGDELSIFWRVYGFEVFGHPKADKEFERFSLLLESLVESGEIKKWDDGAFSLKGKSLTTIAKYAEDERRHRDSKRSNIRLLWLTAIIAIAAFIDIIIRLSIDPDTSILNFFRRN